MTVCLLELNEINFEQVRAYADRGELPVLADLIHRHGVTVTESETRYEDLEPWIQWVTAHTGLSLAEHGIERLGDAVGAGLDQVWEVLERQGLTVGAVSPMNAENRCRNAAFFIPDPWTVTTVTGTPLMQRLYSAIAQAVNDNADARLTGRSAVNLALGLARYARPARYAGYLEDVAGIARRRPWRKAMLLDRLLADVMIAETRRHRPDFVSLFLNAGAHIQHHYLFNSATYQGPLENPAWYVDRTADPVLDVYRLYDAIVGDIRAALPASRLLIATGLHQNPHGAVTLYWRLKDHAAFLRAASVPFVTVEPRMSRDFLVQCKDEGQAKQAAARLATITAEQGQPLFSVDNRGSSLFVMLTWSEDIGADFVYLVDGDPRRNLREEVAFVAIKNGEHDGAGYLIDTANATASGRVPLASLPSLVASACGVAWSPRPAGRVPVAA